MLCPVPLFAPFPRVPSTQVEAVAPTRSAPAGVEQLSVLGLMAALINFGIYDSRARGMVRRVASHFALQWSEVGEAEDYAMLSVAVPCLPYASTPEGSVDRCVQMRTCLCLYVHASCCMCMRAFVFALFLPPSQVQVQRAMVEDWAGHSGGWRSPGHHWRPCCACHCRGHRFSGACPLPTVCVPLGCGALTVVCVCVSGAGNGGRHWRRGCWYGGCHPGLDWCVLPLFI